MKEPSSQRASRYGPRPTNSLVNRRLLANAPLSVLYRSSSRCRGSGVNPRACGRATLAGETLERRGLAEQADGEDPGGRGRWGRWHTALAGGTRLGSAGAAQKQQAKGEERGATQSLSQGPSLHAVTSSDL